MEASSRKIFGRFCARRRKNGGGRQEVSHLDADARDGGAAALSSPHHDADESSVRHAY